MDSRIEKAKRELQEVVVEYVVEQLKKEGIDVTDYTADRLYSYLCIKLSV